MRRLLNTMSLRQSLRLSKLNVGFSDNDWKAVCLLYAYLGWKKFYAFGGCWQKSRDGERKNFFWILRHVLRKDS